MKLSPRKLITLVAMIAVLSLLALFSKTYADVPAGGGDMPGEGLGTPGDDAAADTGGGIGGGDGSSCSSCS